MSIQELWYRKFIGRGCSFGGTAGCSRGKGISRGKGGLGYKYPKGGYGVNGGAIQELWYKKFIGQGGYGINGGTLDDIVSAIPEDNNTIQRRKRNMLKDIPEFDLTIPPKIKSVQSKAPVKKMIKSDKVLKELDELMKDVDKIIAEHTKATKSNKPKMMTKKAEKDIIQRVNNEIDEVSKMVKIKSTKPKAEPKPKAAKPKATKSSKASKAKTQYEKLINDIDKENMTNFWVLCNMKKFEPMTNIKKDKMKSDIKESPDTWNKLIANINLIHTSLDAKPKDANLSAINTIKKKIKNKVFKRVLMFLFRLT